MPNPAVFGRYRFFDKPNKEKNCCVQLGSLGGWGAVSPPKWDPGAKPEKIFGYFAL